MQPKILVTDFDGTLTRREFYGLAQQRHIPPGLPDFFELYRHRQLTHFEALAAIFSRVRASDEEIEQLLTDMELEPRLKELVARLKAAGWQVVITSAGCHWYIDKLLARAGVQLTVHANPGDWSPETGLIARLPTESPFFSATHGIDKAAVVRDALDRASLVAFAGDGYPDLPAAELVPESLRFACSMLAEALTARGLGYRPFKVWSEVAETLLEEHPC